MADHHQRLAEEEIAVSEQPLGPQQCTVLNIDGDRQCIENREDFQNEATDESETSGPRPNAEGLRDPVQWHEDELKKHTEHFEKCQYHVTVPIGSQARMATT